jgi:hypothetical protein
VVAKVRERLAVNKQRLHRFHMERFNLKQFNEVEGIELWKISTQMRKLIVLGKQLERI